MSRAAIAAVDVGSQQEAGTRPSCALPYELHVNAEATPTGIGLTMEARTKAFGARSLGAPFNAYAYGAEFQARAYGVAAGELLRDQWPAMGAYHLRLDGPNGFMREFRDGSERTALQVVVSYASGKGAKGAIEIRVSNTGPASREVVIHDESYGGLDRRATLRRSSTRTEVVQTAATGGWYDFTVRAGDLAWRYAGRVETDRWTITDPAMGGR